jgi:hypothetical protein
MCIVWRVRGDRGMLHSSLPEGEQSQNRPFPLLDSQQSPVAETLDISIRTLISGQPSALAKQMVGGVEPDRLFDDIAWP